MRKVVAIVVLFGLIAAIPAAVQADLDPNTLIGTYDGKWTYQHFSESAELKITEIRDNRLVGKIFYTGRGGATMNQWWKFTDGRFDGTTLTFTASNGGTFTLTITSNETRLELRGRSDGLAVNAELEFYKKNHK